jgi:hypothetical protein
VANLLIRLVVVFLVVFVWQFVATLLMRLFGARLPLQPFSKNRKLASQRLTFYQCVWEGLLLYGCGMFIVLTLLDYLGCRYGNAACGDLSLNIRVYAVLWPVVGLFVGALHEVRTGPVALRQGIPELKSAAEHFRVNAYNGDVSPTVETRRGC